MENAAAPTILTRRFLLRQPTAADFPQLLRLCNDRSISRWIPNITYPYTVRAARDYLKLVAARDAASGRPAGFIVTFRHNPRLVVGAVGAMRRPNGDVVLGYWIGRAYRGRGFTVEAIEALVAKVLPENGRVIATFLEGNHASRRVMERLGMRRIGAHPRRHSRQGRLLYTINYAISAEGWRRRNS
jgi:RimJ/RimL family protein N-acetyltransferase